MSRRIEIDPSEALFLVVGNTVENRNIDFISFVGTREATAAYLKKSIASWTEPSEYYDVQDFSGDELVTVAQNKQFKWFHVRPIWINQEIPIKHSV